MGAAPFVSIWSVLVENSNSDALVVQPASHTHRETVGATEAKAVGALPPYDDRLMADGDKLELW